MAKTTFRITHTKTMRKMSYSGDLKEAIRKAETELKKRAESKEEAHLRWQYQKAKKELDTYARRTDDLTDFIRIAKEHLEKEEGETETET